MPLGAKPGYPCPPPPPFLAHSPLLAPPFALHPSVQPAKSGRSLVAQRSLACSQCPSCFQVLSSSSPSQLLRRRRSLLLLLHPISLLASPSHPGPCRPTDTSIPHRSLPPFFAPSPPFLPFSSPRVCSFFTKHFYCGSVAARPSGRFPSLARPKGSTSRSVTSSAARRPKTQIASTRKTYLGGQRIFAFSSPDPVDCGIVKTPWDEFHDPLDAPRLRPEPTRLRPLKRSVPQDDAAPS